MKMFRLLLLCATAFIWVSPPQLLALENNETPDMTSILYLLLTPPDSTYPAVAGTYHISNEMAIPTLPAGAQPVLAVLDELFVDPGVALLRIFALAASGESYWEDASWGLLFDECAGAGDPSADCTAQGDVVTTLWASIMVDHLLVVTLEGLQALGISGDSVEDVFGRGLGIFQNAKTFTLEGNLVIPQEPDASGLLGTSGTMALNRLTWRWDGGERTLQLRTERIIRASNIAGAVVFHPSDGTTPSLQLEPFALSLNYPELLLRVVEKVIFPTLIDDSIQSFEDLFTYVFDCELLGDRIDCTGVYADDAECDDSLSFLAAEAETACESLRITAVTALDGWLTSESTYAVMQTPTNDPCRILVDSGGGSPTATGLGASTALCPWSAELRDESSGVETLVGEWWGTRL